MTCVSCFAQHFCQKGAILLPLSHLSSNFLSHYFSIFSQIYICNMHTPPVYNVRSFVFLSSFFPQLCACLCSLLSNLCAMIKEVFFYISFFMFSVCTYPIVLCVHCNKKYLFYVTILYYFFTCSFFEITIRKTIFVVLKDWIASKCI